MKKNAWITVVVVAVLFAGGGFYAGTKYESSKATTSAGAGTFAGRTGGTGRFAVGGFGAGGAGGATTGTILTIGSGTMTIQLPNSTSTTAETGTKIVLFDNSTQVQALENVSPSSLQVGQNVIISGTTNSDGSVTATSIMARPAGSGGGQFIGQGGAGSGSSQ